MDAGQGLALDAGKQVLEQGGIYGPICILLALALIVVVVYAVREIGRLNKELLESERTHGKDSLLMQSSVQKALETVDQTLRLALKAK